MKRYKQKLRDVWLQMPEFRQWLRRDPEESYRARCRFCKCGVNTKLSDLRAHAATKKHMIRSNSPYVKTNDSSVEGDNTHFDHDFEYKPKGTKVKRIKSETGRTKNDLSNKPPTVKTEQRSGSNPDYEAIIESLALYEPEEAMFTNESVDLSDHKVRNDISTGNIDEEMITNAVTAAVNNLKDSSQIFGDFVADRLRQMTDKTSEYCKDKIMQVILDVATLERTIEVDPE